MFRAALVDGVHVFKCLLKAEHTCLVSECEGVLANVSVSNFGT